MRHQYANPTEKRLDFWLGFLGWLVVNVLATLLLQSVPSSVPVWVLYALLLAVNLAVPAVLAFVRRYFALGMLVAFATALGVTVALGVFFTVGEFALLAIGPVALVIWALGLFLIPFGTYKALQAITRRFDGNRTSRGF